MDVVDDEIIDLGADHKVKLYRDETTGDITAIVDVHTSSVDGSVCGGMIEIEHNQWQILNIDPLTVVPSINCAYCNSHGVIIAGKWEDHRTAEDYAKWETTHSTNG
jgi:hypothetical protein